MIEMFPIISNRVILNETNKQIFLSVQHFDSSGNTFKFDKL